MNREGKNDDMLEREFIPEPSSVIWKYMNFPEFMNLLQFRKLHFTRADKFKDELEGEIPYFYIESLKGPREDEYFRVIDTYKNCKMRTYINSWSELQKESYAMWLIYSREYGVAIQSTVCRLNRAVNNTQAKIRKVKYISYENGSWNGNVPLLSFDKGKIITKNFFVFKPEFYEYEREIRAILTDDREERYREVEVDLNVLIENIYVSPFADRWFSSLVKEIVCSQYRFNDIKVHNSGMEIQKN